MPRRKINIGDKVTFKAATLYSYETVTRKVKEVYASGNVAVRYAGYSDFIVYPQEIKKVEKSI